MMNDKKKIKICYFFSFIILRKINLLLEDSPNSKNQINLIIKKNKNSYEFIISDFNYSFIEHYDGNLLKDILQYSDIIYCMDLSEGCNFYVTPHNCITEMLYGFYHSCHMLFFLTNLYITSKLELKIVRVTTELYKKDNIVIPSYEDYINAPVTVIYHNTINK